MDLNYPLQEYGLTDKEIKVYLAILPLGTVKLQEIARRLKYPRTTVYNTLSYLITKGLVSKIIRKGVTYYTATEPEKLRDELEEKKNLIEAALPELNNLRTLIQTTSKVELYEGFKGVHTILSHVFKTKQQVYYFGGYHNSLEILKHLPAYARALRIERKIPAKIVIEPADDEVFHTSKYKSITEMRFNRALKDFPLMVFIYGNNVGMYTVKGELVGVRITNKEFSIAMRMIFDIYWHQGKTVKL